MADPSPASALEASKLKVSAALNELEPLGTDQYCIAFGPGYTQFCATPNGYTGNELPQKIVDDLLRGQVQKIIHASFGDDAQSFFFTYQMKDGSIAHRPGTNLPKSLQFFASRAAHMSKECISSLRVQLGSKGSYVAWTGATWVAQGIPADFFAALRGLSSDNFDEIKGSVLRKGLLDNIAWHDNGSWYLKNGDDHLDNFTKAAEVVQKAWTDLILDTEFDRADLAHVAINPHSHTGGSFAFFKKARPGRELEFVLRFEPDDVVSHLYPKEGPLVEERTGIPDDRKQQHTNTDAADRLDECTSDNVEIDTTKASKSDNGIENLDKCTSENLEINTTKASKSDNGIENLDECTQDDMNTNVITTAKNNQGLQVYQWAISRYSGRPHPRDSWELELRKGERVKVQKYMGKDWFIVKNLRGHTGWAHRAWLDFRQMLPHVDPREAYTKYTADVEKLLKAGNIRNFPNLNSYMNACNKDACSSLKAGTDGLGICNHDLHELMRGSGDYCLDKLKMERNKWHPDKFARYCHPDTRDALREKAQSLFVMFGVLMDMLQNPPEPAAFD